MSAAPPPTLRVFPDAASFYDAAGALLLAREVENERMVATALDLRDKGDAAPEGCWFSIVEIDGVARSASMEVAPRALQLTDAAESDLALLVEGLQAAERRPPAVLGPAETAEAFGRAWSRAVNVRVVPAMSLALHTIDRVAYAPDVPGRMRQARAEDLELARLWEHRFAIDCNLPTAKEPPEHVPALDEGRLFFWETDRPRAMAAWARPTPSGVTVSHVYTPDDERGNGWGTAIVAALTRKLLDDGRSYVSLFTDLSNPVSNKIYAKIGYRRIADFRNLRFQ